jgi:hypothetical protein
MQADAYGQTAHPCPSLPPGRSRPTPFSGISTTRISASPNDPENVVITSWPMELPPISPIGAVPRNEKLRKTSDTRGTGIRPQGFPACSVVSSPLSLPGRPLFVPHPSRPPVADCGLGVSSVSRGEGVVASSPPVAQPPSAGSAGVFGEAQPGVRRRRMLHETLHNFSFLGTEGVGEMVGNSIGQEVITTFSGSFGDAEIRVVRTPVFGAVLGSCLGADLGLSCGAVERRMKEGS